MTVLARLPEAERLVRVKGKAAKQALRKLRSVSHRDTGDLDDTAG